MQNDILKILITEEEIQRRVREIGENLARDYAGKFPVVICVLKGSVMFFADLLKYMPIPLTLDFMSVSSYRNGTAGGAIHIRQELTAPVEDRNVIIVEDIIDSGRTLSMLKPLLMARGANSVGIVTLLDKPSRRDPNVTLVPEYMGFESPDEFVVGYGLDYAERYRNLPYIGVLKPEIYENA